jgi:hypothetical protein
VSPGPIWRDALLSSASVCRVVRALAAIASTRNATARPPQLDRGYPIAWPLPQASGVCRSRSRLPAAGPSRSHLWRTVAPDRLALIVSIGKNCDRDLHLGDLLSRGFDVLLHPADAGVEPNFDPGELGLQRRDSAFEFADATLV